MIPALLDVNVLLALLQEHEFHGQAERWFQENRSAGWVTCAVTEAGFVRIAAQVGTPVAEAWRVLDAWCATPEHRFWPLDAPLIGVLGEIRRRVRGAKQLTDAILLDLAIRRGGRLVTFDARVRTLLPEDSPHQAAIAVIRP